MLQLTPTIEVTIVSHTEIASLLAEHYNCKHDDIRLKNKRGEQNRQFFDAVSDVFRAIVHCFFTEAKQHNDTPSADQHQNFKMH